MDPEVETSDDGAGRKSPHDIASGERRKNFIDIEWLDSWPSATFGINNQWARRFLIPSEEADTTRSFEGDFEPDAGGIIQAQRFSLRCSRSRHKRGRKLGRARTHGPTPVQMGR
jgi:hypothetical protein